MEALGLVLGTFVASAMALAVIFGVDAEGHLPMMITIYILAAIGAISVLVTAVIVLAALAVTVANAIAGWHAPTREPLHDESSAARKLDLLAHWRADPQWLAPEIHPDQNCETAEAHQTPSRKSQQIEVR